MTPVTKFSTQPYDPGDFRALSFHDRLAWFERGADDPRAYLERCLETIAAREPEVRAFAAMNIDGARKAADGSARRWREGRPQSPIDGMPIGIKDLIETKDMPTEMGCNALKGNFPERDSAAVWALRGAGAVILGKTVTAELGGAHPGPTRNPFDLTRTPGGSSSGSAAAVAAGMVPAAIGTQVGGSIIRPASYCGNVALKPSQGAINRGERQTTSQSTHGVHAGSIEDLWQVAAEIVARVGGDRGAAGLAGPMVPPAPRRPNSLVVIETAGWTELDARSRAAFDGILARLRQAGIALLDRRGLPEAEAFECAIIDADPICNAITGWENRWIYRDLADRRPGAISPRAMKVLEQAEAMTPADYRAALAARAEAQARHARLAPFADALLTLASPGPAPVMPEDKPGAPLAPRPNGRASFNYAASMLFAPAVAVPLCAVGGLPLGIQLMGLPGEDAHVVGIARWVLETLEPVAID